MVRASNVCGDSAWSQVLVKSTKESRRGGSKADAKAETAPRKRRHKAKKTCTQDKQHTTKQNVDNTKISSQRKHLKRHMFTWVAVIAVLLLLGIYLWFNQRKKKQFKRRRWHGVGT